MFRHPEKSSSSSYTHRYCVSIKIAKWFAVILDNVSLAACISADGHAFSWVQEVAVQHRRSCHRQDRLNERNSHSTSSHLMGARGKFTQALNVFSCNNRSFILIPRFFRMKNARIKWILCVGKHKIFPENIRLLTSVLALLSLERLQQRIAKLGVPYLSVHLAACEQ